MECAASEAVLRRAPSGAFFERKGADCLVGGRRDGSWLFAAVVEKEAFVKRTFLLFSSSKGKMVKIPFLQDGLYDREQW